MCASVALLPSGNADSSANMHLQAESGARAAASRRRRDLVTAGERNSSNRSLS